MQRLEPILVSRTDHQEPRAGGSEEPLVEVAGVKVRGDIGDVEWNHRWGMRSIDHGDDPAFSSFGAQLLGG
jgi:hypothetical protein